MDIDIIDPKIYEVGVPYPLLKQLRKESPLFFHKEKNGRGFWAVLKYRDVVSISRDPATFSSWKGTALLPDVEGDDLEANRFMMLSMDPPQHTKFRGLVRGGFVPKMIAKLEESIRSRVAQILDSAEVRGEVDFLTDVAGMLPLEVIAEMIGIPAADRAMVFSLSDQMVASVGPQDLVEAASTLENAKVAAMTMWGYAGELAQNRYDNPSDDLISILMHATVDGEKLSPMEFAAFFMLLVVAGNETTRNVIANGMLSLIENPDQFARLQADPSLINSAVEEILRAGPPIIQFRRTAMRDVEIRGQKIKEGDKIAMFYTSANRDEEIFADSDRFDITRTPNEHISFGIGQHVCLGNSLARLEIRAMFEALISRFQRFELSGPVKRMRSNFVNGIVSMPMRLVAHDRKARAAL